MIHEVSVEDFYKSVLPLIDVRSPGEFRKGHIPGAVNIPLFSDEERAHVGTVYVKNSREEATELAFRYIDPKLDGFILQAEKIAVNRHVAVHCWRGGMRSQSFAQHLHEHGFSHVCVIAGGYKSYRNYVLNTFNNPADLRIVGGYTGSGKSDIIRYIMQKGLQVIDLEKIANHKGSAFGGINQPEQPTPEQFENNLFEEWKNLDLSKPVWLEDESHNIGGVNIPMNLYQQMQNSPLFFITIPKEQRARKLVEEYANADPELLAESIRKIHKRLGGQNTKRALELLSEHKFFEVAMLTLQYYDKSYLKGMTYRRQDNIYRIEANNTDTTINAELLLKYTLNNE